MSLFLDQIDLEKTSQVFSNLNNPEDYDFLIENTEILKPDYIHSISEKWFIESEGAFNFADFYYSSVSNILRNAFKINQEFRELEFTENELSKEKIFFDFSQALVNSEDVDWENSDCSVLTVFLVVASILKLNDLLCKKRILEHSIFDSKDGDRTSALKDDIECIKESCNDDISSYLLGLSPFLVEQIVRKRGNVCLRFLEEL